MFLGGHYYGQDQPRYSLKGQGKIRQPSQTFGWADAACITFEEQEVGNGGVIWGPEGPDGKNGSYGWVQSRNGRGNGSSYSVITMRHGSRSRKKILAANELEYPNDANVRTSNAAYVDGHCETIDLEAARNPNNYFSGGSPN